MKIRKKKVEINAIEDKVIRLLNEGFHIECIRKMLGIRKDLLSNIISRIVIERKVNIKEIYPRIVTSDLCIKNIVGSNDNIFYEVEMDDNGCLILTPYAANR